MSLWSRFLLLSLLPSGEFSKRVKEFRKAVEFHCAGGQPFESSGQQQGQEGKSPLSLLPRPQMDLNAQASTSAVPLSDLPPSQLKDITANILTEHFGWAPESFAKQGMDLANVAMYSATEAVEKILMEKVGLPHAEGEVALDEEEIQKVHPRTRLVYRSEELTRCGFAGNLPPGDSS